MAIYGSFIDFGGLNLEITSVNPRRVIKTKKQVVGKNLYEIKILGMNEKQWVLDVRGVITADSLAELESKRRMLQLLDDTAPHTYIDGYHDGIYYIVPESLDFNDVGGDNYNIYRYSMTLVER